MGNIAIKVCTIRITDLDALKQRPKTQWAKLDHVVIVAAIHSSVVSSIAPDQWCMLLNLLSQYSHTLKWNGFKSGENGGHS